MKTIEILTHTHTHEGVNLQKGALIQVSEALAKILVNMRIGREVIADNNQPHEVNQ